MRVYRLVKKEYANDMSGQGAKLTGGRWNRKGLPVIYTSENASLALLETIAHSQFLHDLYGRILVEMEVSTRSMVRAQPAQFSPDWSKTPWQQETIQYGSDWLEANTHLLLRVPSSIDPIHYNILINPRHHLFPKIKIVNQTVFRPDNRLRLGPE